ncbi:hypothetical protein P3T36_006623 [Kitasatospora sp. MAP12-15]|uniref:hypothetical protein n=1 Tax=unclassified Kitasatospora TaxID=2633591 RepID=UPI0024742EC1|nr:hypothetical protein [Kitasatospora sp. MAP12-44]MDH6115435.1 hypothetical protein [Kitasatospora sp. MAP12-44]
MNTRTTRTTATMSRGLRLALRAYPAAYRAERGEEITAVHADATEGAGRLATARETAGIAAYGLRVRTGTTASGTGGRLLATTAPLAAAMALCQQLPFLWHLPQEWQMAIPTADTIGDGRPSVVAAAVPGVLWLLVVAAMLLRRWTAARILAVLAAVAAVAQWFVGYLLEGMWAPGLAPDYASLVSTAGAGVLWALLVFAAPGDLLDSTAVRRPRDAVLPVLLPAVSILQNHLDLFGVPGQTAAMLTGVYFVLNLLPLASLRWGRLLPAATALAALPLTLSFSMVFAFYGVFPWYSSWYGDLGVLVRYLLAVTLVTLVTVAAVRYLKPTPETQNPLSTK